MKPLLPLLAIALAPALAFAPQALAVPGGKIGTLAKGNYVCELPGDAAGLASVHVPEADFRVVNASSYRSQGVRGSYLLTGDDMVMTSGPRNGERYRRQSRGLLRRLGPDGSETDLRCVLGGTGASTALAGTCPAEPGAVPSSTMARPEDAAEGLEERGRTADPAS